MTVEILLESYEKNALPELPPGFMGTHFVRSDDRINRLLQLEASWKGKFLPYKYESFIL